MSDARQAAEAMREAAAHLLLTALEGAGDHPTTIGMRAIFREQAGRIRALPLPPASEPSGDAGECLACRAGCHHDEACWRYWNHKALELVRSATDLRAEVGRLTRERDKAQKMLRCHEHALSEQLPRAIAAEAGRDRLREALSATVEYMEFNATENCRPFPLDRARAALQGEG